MNNMIFKGTLQKNILLNDQYTVLLFVRKGHNTETYRVKGKDGKLYFLKLFNVAQIHRTSFDSIGRLLEIEFLKQVEHPNIVAYKDSGEVIVDDKKYLYLISDFIAGETLAERISREPISSLYDVKQMIAGVLNGLAYLHALSEPIIHNEITPQNIMLDLSNNIPQAKIIDFGYARSFHQSSKAYHKEGLNLHYVASECIMAGAFSPQSDLFSVSAVMYYLLFGMLPWAKDISMYTAERVKAKEIILEAREKLLIFPNVENRIVDFDASILKIIKKGLCPDTEERFQSATEFLQALNGEIEIDDVDTKRKIKAGEQPAKPIAIQKAKGKGFEAVAGMKELKNQLQVAVIDVLRNPAEYEKYGVTIPNGMLLYGPSGCGKTFFAKHFAEEVGFNFLFMTPSSLKSRYINATQENIAKMFKEAEENAPIIIFIDEINELLPNRDSNAHEMSKSAVNEMLAQMDRTGEKGIFIIGATNYPNRIDPSMLRAGRLDKKFYLPPPDFETRKIMFEMYLTNRPLDFGIDYEKLANLTENYVSADIELLVKESALLALTGKQRITMTHLETTIKAIKPSIPLHELQKYEAIRKEMEDINGGKPNERPKIGFIRNNQNHGNND
jgi:transitional endoplasmic reticulum ATPase